MCRKRRQEHKLILGGGGLSPSPSTAARFLSDVTPHPLFSHKEVDRGIFHIEEKFFDSWNRANVFYVVGSQKDLLIDTGKFRHLANGMAIMLYALNVNEMFRKMLRVSVESFVAEVVHPFLHPVIPVMNFSLFFFVKILRYRNLLPRRIPQVYGPTFAVQATRRHSDTFPFR